MSAALTLRDESHPDLHELAERSPPGKGPPPALIVLALERVSRRFARSPMSCSELQQEILVALWLSAEFVGPRVSLQTWLCAVADGVGNVAECLSTAAGGANIHLSARAGRPALPEPAAVLLTLLDTFRPAEREAALLDFQHLSLQQIADALRCSPDRARSLITEAQRRLALWARPFADRAAAAAAAAESLA